MEILKQTFAMMFFIALSSCIGDADLTGFIRSTDRIEDRYEMSMQWNADNPFKNIVVSKENYQIMVASDVHVGPTKNYEKFINIAMEDEVAAMVFVGDFVTGKENDYERFHDLLPDYQAKPSFMLTGNHELYFDGWKHFHRLYGSSIYYFTVETPSTNDLYICLDNGSGTIGKSQLQWLQTTLENQRANHRYCVVFMHVNFFRGRHTTSTNPRLDENLVIMDLFEKHQIDLVITAHDHQRSYEKLGRTSYLVTDALKDDNRNASYIVLTGEKDKELQFEYVEM